MAIIENKLQVILLIVIFMFSSVTIITIFNVSYVQWKNYEMELQINNTGGVNLTDAQTTGVDYLSVVLGSLFLQIADAPPIINAITGLIMSIMITALSLTIIAFVREMIGLT